MQPLKDKILEGFFTNVGADPITNWINEVFKTTKVKYCTRLYITSKDTADSDFYESEYEYKVTKTYNRSLLFNKIKAGSEKSIIINISEIPELLNIKPNDMSIFYANDRKNENIKFLFGQHIKAKEDINTYINNVLLTIDKKTGTIIDKEVIQKFLITDIPF